MWLFKKPTIVICPYCDTELLCAEEDILTVAGSDQEFVVCLTCNKPIMLQKESDDNDESHN